MFLHSSSRILVQNIRIVMACIFCCFSSVSCLLSRLLCSSQHIGLGSSQPTPHSRARLQASHHHQHSPRHNRHHQCSVITVTAITISRIYTTAVYNPLSQPSPPPPLYHQRHRQQTTTFHITIITAPTIPSPHLPYHHCPYHTITAPTIPSPRYKTQINSTRRA